MSGGYGFSGIVAALFGKLHPLGVIPASFFFGGLLVGADKMQRAMQVPSSLITVINGLVVMFVVASDVYVRRARRRYTAETTARHAGKPAARRSRSQSTAGGHERMSEILTVTALVGILSSGIRLATPYLFAALGETLGQRSGVLNLGVEGMMLMGAFAGYYAVLKTATPGWAWWRPRVGALMGLSWP